MEGMGGTLTPVASTVTPATVSTAASTVWEDVMNDLIGQWSGSATTSAPGNNMDVQQCVDSILSMEETFLEQVYVDQCHVWHGFVQFSVEQPKESNLLGDRAHEVFLVLS